MLIDTSLNFASVMGILLSSTSAIFFIVYFLENERINFINNAIILLSFIGGLILSFQGWKLDPPSIFGQQLFWVFFELVPLVTKRK